MPDQIPATGRRRSTRGAQQKSEPGRASSSEETRARILQASIHLFGSRGFDATSVQSLVEESAVTKGAFYHHFASKEELLREIHDMFIDTQLMRAEEVIARDLDSAGTLRALISEVLIQPTEQYKAEMAIFFAERRFLTEELFEQIRIKRDRFERIIRNAIIRGIEDGTFAGRGEPPRLTAFAIIGMCAWTVHWLDSSRGSAKVADVFSNLVLQGLLASRPSPRQSLRSSGSS